MLPGLWAGAAHLSAGGMHLSMDPAEAPTCWGWVHPSLSAVWVSPCPVALWGAQTLPLWPGWSELTLLPSPAPGRVSQSPVGHTRVWRLESTSTASASGWKAWLPALSPPPPAPQVCPRAPCGAWQGQASLCLPKTPLGHCCAIPSACWSQSSACCPAPCPGLPAAPGESPGALACALKEEMGTGPLIDPQDRHLCAQTPSPIGTLAVQTVSWDEVCLGEGGTW